MAQKSKSGVRILILTQKSGFLKIFPKFGNLGIKVVQTCVSTRNYEALGALFSSSC